MEMATDPRLAPCIRPLRRYCDGAGEGKRRRSLQHRRKQREGRIEIVKLILSELHKPESLIQHVADRPGHDRRYAVDNSKITAELGWKPSYTFKQGMKETIQWYLSNGDWLSNVTSGTYQEYYQKMYERQ